MKRFVQYAPRFHTCLKNLDKAGGKAVLAAERARTIISKLIEEGEQSPFDIGRLTGHGEGRVRNCLKYNLGKRVSARLPSEWQRLHVGLTLGATTTVTVGSADSIPWWRAASPTGRQQWPKDGFRHADRKNKALKKSATITRRRWPKDYMRRTSCAYSIAYASVDKKGWELRFTRGPLNMYTWKQGPFERTRIGSRSIRKILD